jgi:hypothetical protein
VGDVLYLTNGTTDEEMIVTSITAPVTVSGGYTSNVTVDRGYFSTTPIGWVANTSIDQVLYGQDTCETKHVAGVPFDYDIAFQQIGAAANPTGLNGVSGTIYAPGPRADFLDEVSGTANLAVLTSCMLINGATSTFNYDASNNQLFGVGESLVG